MTDENISTLSRPAEPLKALTNGDLHPGLMSGIIIMAPLNGDNNCPVVMCVDEIIPFQFSRRA